MAGENGVLSVAGYGKRRVVVNRIQHGLSAYPGGISEDQSRSGKAFMASYKDTSSSVTLDLLFMSHEAQEEFVDWVRDYLVKISNPSRRMAAMEVMVPVRSFHVVGIPSGDLPYGDRVGAITYKVPLKITGARNVIVDRKRVSTFEEAEDDDPALPYLYPAGKQPASFLIEDEYGEEGIR